MTLKQEKELFESRRNVYDSALLTFHGVEGFDVYNCSIPFRWQGRDYIYGRVEKREQWARSWVRLFERTGPDNYTVVPDMMPYQLEDPYIAFIHGEMVFGGTHVRKRRGEIDTYYGYFYRGSDLNDLVYFTTGPDYMKDIRIIQLADGKIGVFSRPRNEEIRRKYGSGSVIGFAVIGALEELTDDVIQNAAAIDGLFGADEWGGCNQAYLLRDGSIGIIGHKSYADVAANGDQLAVYVNTAFEFDPRTLQATNQKIIGTKACYPACPAKMPALVDCTFTSGIVMRGDGRVDLYAGVGDVAEGRIAIEYPFSQPLR